VRRAMAVSSVSPAFYGKKRRTQSVVQCCTTD
jgi:hypothetical protein